MNYIEYIKEEKLVKRFLIFLVGVFIIAINYNMFIVPNNFVLGGASGLAVILKSLFGFEPVLSIYVISFFLLIVSYFLLGLKETRRALIGSILYPFTISLTAPLAKLLLPYFTFDNVLVLVLIGALLNGLGNGLIYKVGFNTGGGDILMKIVNKYAHVTEGTAALYCNTAILFTGYLVVLRLYYILLLFY